MTEDSEGGWGGASDPDASPHCGQTLCSASQCRGGGGFTATPRLAGMVQGVVVQMATFDGGGSLRPLHPNLGGKTLVNAPQMKHQ